MPPYCWCLLLIFAVKEYSETCRVIREEFETTSGLHKSGLSREVVSLQRTKYIIQALLGHDQVHGLYREVVPGYKWSLGQVSLVYLGIAVVILACNDNTHKISSDCKHNYGNWCCFICYRALLCWEELASSIPPSLPTQNRSTLNKVGCLSPWLL